MSLLRALEETLSRHVPALDARLVVERCRRSLRDPTLSTTEERTRFLATVRSSLRLFTSDEKAAAITEEVDKRLLPTLARKEREQVCYPICNEEDLRTARAGARDLCLAFSASSADAHRVATAVSELARNIVAYTPGGQIDITIRRGPPTRVSLVAQDRGPGILALDQVLAGTYRSKTGLGRGLCGVKRLMHQFRIQTGPSGTRIEAEITFS